MAQASSLTCPSRPNRKLCAAAKGLQIALEFAFIDDPLMRLLKALDAILTIIAFDGSSYRRPLSCRGNMAFSLPYFDVHFFGAILVKARPKRNISATVVADVKRFSHQINTDEVFGTHRWDGA